MNLLKRNILPSIFENLQYKEFIVITGPRQSGKTSVLKLIENHIQAQGEITVFLTLEDPLILKKFNEHPENLFSVLPSTGKKIYVLIDEIQYLSDPTNFLKYNFDLYNEKVKIICTGSSAFYIDQKFRDSLAGRKLIFNLYTLSFNEFLYFKTGDDSLNDELNEFKKRVDYLSPKSMILKRLLDEYLVFGGYPVVVLSENQERKKLLLSELSQSFLRRDILESNVREEEKFFMLIRMLAAQTGGMLNVNQLANSLQLSVTAIDNYIQILRKIFHIQLVKPFFNNVRKELTKMPKIYFNDLGMRNMLLSQFADPETRMDRGELIENYIFLRLRDTVGEANVFFWRTADGNEIDFIIKTEFGKGYAIESKFDEKAFAVSKYKKFVEAYPQFPLSVKSYTSTNPAASLYTL